MPSHDPWDGTVPQVVKWPNVPGVGRWYGMPSDSNLRDRGLSAQGFATWREALNYALSTTE